MASRERLLEDIDLAVRSTLPQGLHMRPFGSYLNNLSVFMSDVDVSVVALRDQTNGYIRGDSIGDNGGQAVEGELEVEQEGGLDRNDVEEKKGDDDDDERKDDADGNEDDEEDIPQITWTLDGHHSSNNSHSSNSSSNNNHSSSSSSNGSGSSDGSGSSGNVVGHCTSRLGDPDEEEDGDEEEALIRRKKQKHEHDTESEKIQQPLSEDLTTTAPTATIAPTATAVGSMTTQEVADIMMMEGDGPMDTAVGVIVNTATDQTINEVNEAVHHHDNGHDIMQVVVSAVDGSDRHAEKEGKEYPVKVREEMDEKELGGHVEVGEAREDEIVEMEEKWEGENEKENEKEGEVEGTAKGSTRRARRQGRGAAVRRRALRASKQQGAAMMTTTTTTTTMSANVSSAISIDDGASAFASASSAVAGVSTATSVSISELLVMANQTASITTENNHHHHHHHHHNHNGSYSSGSSSSNFRRDDGSGGGALLIVDESVRQYSLQRLHRHFSQRSDVRKAELRRAARVPLVHLVYRRSSVQCDISVGIDVRALTYPLLCTL